MELWAVDDCLGTTLYCHLLQCRSLGWKTRHQLMALYNDENIVNTLVDNKLATGQWRSHPDLPDDDTALLYYAPALAWLPQWFPNSSTSPISRQTNLAGPR